MGKLTYDYSGKTVVMTGGTGVLGSTISLSLAEHGAHVALLARHLEKAKPLVEKAQAMSGSISVHSADVLDKHALHKAAEEILKTHGKVDALINAAGGNHPKATTNPEQSFFQLSEDAFRQVFDVNFLGTILPCQVFGKYMAERKEGVILNVSSMAAYRPLTRVVAYAAAKAAVNNFTYWLAVYMAQEYSPNIRVNAIAPGFFLTEQNRFLLTDKESGALTARGKKIIEHTPASRFGEAKELTGAVLWLLSPESSFVSGVVVPIDGGFSANSGV
ncbi:MAG: SDR family oxidoreductase [Ignavibacteriae bacterium]|nr:SDR family oxidoreductase [Ignavibacteriota bacterium]